MIHVERMRASVPASLQVRARELTSRLLREHSATHFHQSEPVFYKEVYGHDSVIAALKLIFESKCAYCETHIEKAGIHNVGHYRPLSRASDQNGAVSAKHYFWLAYDWNNLLLICRECKRWKGSKFPIAAQRSQIGTEGVALLTEEPMLLDPTRDDPERHLEFALTGVVAPKSERGEITIATLKLDRRELISARLGFATQLRNLLNNFQEQGIPPSEWRASLRTQLVDLHGFNAVANAVLPLGAADKPRSPRAGPMQRRLEPRPDSPSAQRLERLEIEHFRAIEHLDVRFPEVSPEWANDNFDRDIQEPWLVLLGNNGIGKSSILKAVALALAAPSARARWAPNQAELLTRGHAKKQGRVRLWFADRRDPYEWAFGSRQAANRTSMPGIRTPVLAYGSTRLLPHSRPLLGQKPALMRLGNLFTAAEALSDAEAWLTSPQAVSRAQFNLFATDLKHLLAMDDNDSLERNRGKLNARLYRKQLSVRELSDGFQSVLALALDLTFNLSSVSGDMRSVEGLVLIDEIEVHLHPTWKRRIVRELRQMFPRCRFIVTTHDPLCVQGLAPGELHVPTRDARARSVHIRQVDVPLGLRADQVLTGEWFGMDSTRDPDTLRLMDRHSQLLLIRERTPALEAEQKCIEQTLRERLGRFAESPYERAGLQAYAEFAPKGVRVSAEVEQEQLRARIRELLPDR